MQNSLPLIIESRIHGDMYVRFGGRHFETYHRKVERRMMPSLLPYVVKLCYAIAGVVAVVGAISVYIKMNNEEQDVKKSIMMIVGACIFLVAAAQALPLFFGVTS